MITYNERPHQSGKHTYCEWFSDTGVTLGRIRNIKTGKITMKYTTGWNPDNLKEDKILDQESFDFIYKFMGCDNIDLVDDLADLGVNEKIKDPIINLYYYKNNPKNMLDQWYIRIVPNHYNRSLEYIKNVLDHVHLHGCTRPKDSDVTVEVLGGDRYSGMLSIEFVTKTKPTDGVELTSSSGLWSSLVIK